MNRAKQEEEYATRKLIRVIAEEGRFETKRYSVAWEMLYPLVMEGKLNRDFTGTATVGLDTFTFAEGYNPVIYSKRRRDNQYNDGL